MYARMTIRKGSLREYSAFYNSHVLLELQCSFLFGKLSPPLIPNFKKWMHVVLSDWQPKSFLGNNFFQQAFKELAGNLELICNFSLSITSGISFAISAARTSHKEQYHS